MVSVGCGGYLRPHGEGGRSNPIQPGFRSLKRYSIAMKGFIIAKHSGGTPANKARGVSALAIDEGEKMLDDSLDGTIQPDDRLPHRYRAFILDADGKVLRSDPLPARDDEAALRLAGALVDGHSVELWDGMRFIEHLDPLGSTK
ncbi:hypothetical protein [Methylobacterium oxalidis]|uniref:Uncharacterized protein n=1 Tax=Methylobacterium oxalidis TaxID=944322 RepID=A0A512JDP2_9HYPH|nr:hypothetical protein [Methylobacterium oxalidis]GEP08038.1 hypothetical protein MOX02_60760 [Methylobacterium oxalidis]GLS66908.1 hypothetical protein GCM10007888_52910 [Methylobacterium oxalidis]